MANTSIFIINESYRRQVLKYVELKKRSKPGKKVVEINDLSEMSTNELNSDDEDEFEDEFEGRSGDDFEINELHRYETNMVTILKYLIDKKKYTNANITHISFGCTKKDFDMKIHNKFSDEWLYVINIKMIINDELLDYHYVSQSMDTYYRNEQHILAMDKELLFNLQGDEFDKLFPEEDLGTDSGTDSDSADESD